MFKIFQSNNISRLEEELNRWLDTNPAISPKLISTGTSPSGMVYLTVYFSVNPKKL
jgi:hypothetical protein